MALDRLSLFVDDQEYKRLCAQPDVMRRADLRATIARLGPQHAELRNALARVLASSPLQKPSGFQGGPENDYFYLDISEQDLFAIADVIADIEISLADSEDGSAELNFVAELHDTWRDKESSRPAV